MRLADLEVGDKIEWVDMTDWMGIIRYISPDEVMVETRINDMFLRPDTYVWLIEEEESDL